MTFANILDSALYHGVISIANLTQVEANCSDLKLSEIRNRLQLKINCGGGGISSVKGQVDTAYIGSLALVSYTLKTELNLDMLAHTETVIEYNASCNRVHTILPEFDMEMLLKCIFWIFARDLMYITISMHYAHSQYCITLYDVHSSVEVSEDTIYILVPLIYIYLMYAFPT
jgi:hypothetical protein